MWAIRTGQLHNAESARVSMPPQLKKVSPPAGAGTTAAAMPTGPSNSDALTEEFEEEEAGGESVRKSTSAAAAPATSAPATSATAAAAPSSDYYVWRVDLEQTRKLASLFLPSWSDVDF